MILPVYNSGGFSFLVERRVCYWGAAGGRRWMGAKNDTCMLNADIQYFKGKLSNMRWMGEKYRW